MKSLSHPNRRILFEAAADASKSVLRTSCTPHSHALGACVRIQVLVRYGRPWNILHLCNIILVDLGFSQIPGPSSSLFGVLLLLLRVRFCA